MLRIYLQNTSYSNIIRIFHLCCHSIQYISLFLWYPEVSHRTQLVDLEFVIPFTKMILCKHDGKKQIYGSFVVLFYFIASPTGVPFIMWSAQKYGSCNPFNRKSVNPWNQNKIIKYHLLKLFSSIITSGIIICKFMKSYL